MPISRAMLLFRHLPLAAHLILLSPTASSTLGHPLRLVRHVDTRKLLQCPSPQRMEVKSTMKPLLDLVPRARQLPHQRLPNPCHWEEQEES